MLPSKYIYDFDEVSNPSREVFGNKGLGLIKMSKLGVPVPPGFIIVTDACKSYYKNNSIDIKNELREHLSFLEKKLNLKFGDVNAPLLVSVRSGAPISMPGMMETVLNIGLNDKTVQGLANYTDNKSFAYNCYKRYMEMYASVVLGVNKELFFNNNLDNDAESDEDIISRYKKIITQAGHSFHQDPYKQLDNAITAIFKSWNCDRAREYRKINDLSDELGTAVIIQAMVFGNKGDKSATGVVFSRNPSNGDNKIFGEFLINAQGEDIVSGAKTPIPVNNYSKNNELEQSMEEIFPNVYNKLADIVKKLELFFKDVQDVEFTLEEGELWILQTRSAKRNPHASVKIAFDLLRDSIINKRDIFQLIEPKSLEKILHSRIDQKTKKTFLTKGLPSSPGAASGKIAFSSQKASHMSSYTNVILLRNETNPEDIAGINASTGILTSRGGMTSHAAVVARGMGKPCVTGASNIFFHGDLVKIGDYTMKEGDGITIDGSTGEVFLGEISTIGSHIDENLKNLLDLAKDYSSGIGVRANAENKRDAEISMKFGADGIGLCRTEHMFFKKERLDLFRKMILVNDSQDRINILDQLSKFQSSDFYDLFKVMNGLPVTIRLLDPPLHEFLPDIFENEFKDMVRDLGLMNSDAVSRVKFLTEINPMLGHRGCRLGVTFPEIYIMQIKAIFVACKKLLNEGIKVIPEIMVPLIINCNEFLYIKSMVKQVLLELGYEIEYKIGSMIELPAAVLNIKQIAQESDFISFGTNDLTQTTLGLSRDDSQKFVHSYMENGIFKQDPFVSIEVNTVGKLLNNAIKEAKGVNKDIKVGICGEHAGDPESIKFFTQCDIDYISCSPFRIPVAKTSIAKFLL